MTTTDAAARRARLALLCCLGAGFATLLDSAVVTYTVPALTSELHADTAGVQWFLAAYSLTFGLGLVPGGRLGDAYGRRGLFIAGMLVFVLGGLLAGFAPGIGWVVAGRVVQGVGAGIISAQVLGVIQDLFTGAARVKALAAYVIAGAAAAVVGPVLSGLVLQLLPAAIAWRVILLLSAPFILATLVLALLFIPREPPAPRRVDLDLPGVLTLGALVVVVTLPVIDPGIGRDGVPVVIAVTAVLFIALVWWERRYAALGRVPLFAPAIVRSPGFLAGNVVALLWFGSVVANGTLLTIFLLQGEGLAALAVAAFFIPAALSRIAASSISSRLYSRIGVRTLPLALTLQLLCLLGVLGATLLPERAAFLTVVVGLEVLLGVSSGLLEPPLRAITLGFAPPGFHGAAASFLQLTQRLSATFCVALVTGVLLAGSTAGAVGVTRASFGGAVSICVGLSAVAVLVSLLPALGRSPAGDRDHPLGAGSGWWRPRRRSTG